MTSSNLTTISKDSLLQSIADQERRIARLEAMLQGEPITSVRIADAAITNAKIANLSADKITTGTLNVTVSIKVRNATDTGDSILIGYQAGGFP